MSIPALFILVSMQMNLPPDLLSSLCYVESKHDIAAVHVDDGATNSLGICQIKLETARELGFKGSEKQLMDPKTNIYYAGAYLAYQMNRYQGDMTKAVISYNLGHAKHLTNTSYQVKVFKQWGVLK